MIQNQKWTAPRFACLSTEECQPEGVRRQSSRGYGELNVDMQRHKDCGEAGGFRDVDVAQDLPYRSEARSLSRKSRGMHENTPDGTDGSGSYCPDPRRFVP